MARGYLKSHKARIERPLIPRGVLIQRHESSLVSAVTALGAVI